MRKNAFTLAEVLITLGIIGVVAALTMPSLIQNHRKHEIESKLAKIYSVMNQAIALTNTEYGDPADWTIDCGHSQSPTCSPEDTLKWFNEHIGKHLQILKTETDENGFYLYLNDGGILYINSHIYDITFYINKKAVENTKAGINQFSFRFQPVLRSYNNIEANKYTVRATFEPATFSWNGTREGLFKAGATDKAYACDGLYASFCAKLIQMNGWKIPQDYPYKF